MPFSDLRATVLDPGLCAGCGACEMVCPPGILVMDPLQPRLREDAGGCGGCGDCLDVCPGLDPGTPAAELALFGRTREPAERWLGVVARSTAAYARDETIRRRGASGGTATTLLAAAMRSLELDAVVVAGRDPDRPWLARSAVCTEPGELVEHAQSTYQLFPHLAALRTVFAEHPSWRVGITGLACHVQAIRKLQRLDTEWGRRIRRQLVFTLEIACSSNTRPSGTETLLTDVVGVALERVAELRFREGEYPGQVSVHTVDGEVLTLPFWRLVRHFKDHKTHRCLSCGDWMSGLADVSVCDGDPDIFQTSQGGEARYEAHAMVLARTAVGERVLDWAVEHDALRAWPAVLADVNLGLDRKRNRRAHYESLGCPLPHAPIPGHVESCEVVPDDVLIPEVAPALGHAG
ncbi:MAG TPA: Coenzyme F420 hydrogenase/dehydrogenase, beta subunit C-terminal domain [Longimicrobiaceae bacterium]|nr:Coenzyme F420 hydrogenase/dehydrogenase, beta subunit C-terminal domain [Longimicrobiaceae bacterium]